METNSYFDDILSVIFDNYFYNRLKNTSKSTLEKEDLDKKYSLFLKEPEEYIKKKEKKVLNKKKILKGGNSDITITSSFENLIINLEKIIMEAKPDIKLETIQNEFIPSSNNYKNSLDILNKDNKEWNIILDKLSQIRLRCFIIKLNSED